jgi:hypothetical protein
VRVDSPLCQRQYHIYEASTNSLEPQVNSPRYTNKPYTAIDALSPSISLTARFVKRSILLFPCTSELQKATLPLTNSHPFFEGKSQINRGPRSCLFQNVEAKGISRLEVQLATKLYLFSFVAHRTSSNAALLELVQTFTFRCTSQNTQVQFLPSVTKGRPR